MVGERASVGDRTVAAENAVDGYDHGRVRQVAGYKRIAVDSDIAATGVVEIAFPCGWIAVDIELAVDGNGSTAGVHDMLGNLAVATHGDRVRPGIADRTTLKRPYFEAARCW